MSDHIEIPATGKVSGAVLLAAVRELTSVVKALDTTLREDYPKREEITRNRKYFAAAILIALFLSFFLTINTVSYCFLQGIPEKGDRRVCLVFPGYESSFDNNRKNIEIFMNMQSQIKRNQTEIDRLQKLIEFKN